MPDKELPLERIVQINWTVVEIRKTLISTGGGDVCNCDITLTNGVTLKNKTMDYNENTFLNFPFEAGGITASSVDTLTNKSISGSTNTLSNIPASALTGSVSATHGGTGLSAQPSGNYILGSNAAGNAYEGKQLIAGANTTITHGTGTVTIASSGGGSIFKDSDLYIYEELNPSQFKVVKFDVSQMSANSTSPTDNPKLFALPGLSSGAEVIICASAIQTMTNKTLTTPTINEVNVPGLGIMQFPNTGSANLIGSNGSNGKVRVAPGVPVTSGTSTAAIGTLTTKPGSANVTDAAAWLIITDGTTEYAMPLFALN